MPAVPFYDPRLGRFEPKDFAHMSAYPFAAVAPTSVAEVEKTLALPYWHKTHDQGQEGSCVGHGLAMERSIVNTRQNVLAKLPWPTVRRYNPIHIWNEAKKIDEWADTNPGDSNGTSLRAGYDILRLYGCQRCKGMTFLPGQVVPSPVWPKKNGLDVPYPIDIAEGIQANRWATTVDEMRVALSEGKAVAIGVNWYQRFYPGYLEEKSGAFGRKEYWLSTNTGAVMGGHCVAIYAASDKRQAFKLKNSWGAYYPEAWIPYVLMQRLLDEHGEAAIVTDR